MCSDKTSRRPVELIVKLDSDVQLRIINGHNEAVVEQTGTFEGQLLPGRYVVHVERHGLIRTQSVWLTPKRGRLKLTQADFNLTYRSAAPLQGVRKGLKERKTPEDVAAEHSTTQPILPLGEGSEIFLFVRAADVSSRRNPARNIQLFSENGETLADLNESENLVAVGPRHSWASVRFAVDPGNYLLRIHSGARRYDRIITAGSGFQTQVFLNYGRTDRDHWGINPGTSSVLAGYIDDGFRSTNEHSQMADLMLRALESGEYHLERSIVSNAMVEKISDPMLGVYLGIYLANSLEQENEPLKRDSRARMSLGARDRTLRQIDLILQNVRPGFVQSTDLAILAAWFDIFNGGTGSGVVPLNVPPMLVASWPLVRQIELKQPAFIAPASLAFRAALGPLSAGPWFSWRPLGSRHLDLDRTNEDIPDVAMTSFVDAVRSMEQTPTYLAKKFGDIESVQASPDESLADIFARVKVERRSDANDPQFMTDDPRELLALSRYALLETEELPVEDVKIQDKLTGAIISPAEGVASLKIQLGRSLEHVIDSLKNIKT